MYLYERVDHSTYFLRNMSDPSVSNSCKSLARTHSLINWVNHEAYAQQTGEIRTSGMVRIIIRSRTLIC